MKREIEGLEAAEEDILKTERRRRARVVLPEEEGPDRPMMRVVVFCSSVIMACRSEEWDCKCRPKIKKLK